MFDTKGLPGANWTTLPQFFKQQGFLTVGGGKLFHPNKPPDNDGYSRNKFALEFVEFDDFIHSLNYKIN